MPKCKKITTSDSEDIDIYSKILEDGLNKLFKVTKKKIKDKKGEMYEFIIKRTKKYPEYNKIESLQILAENCDKYIENKKISQKDFKVMNNNQEYICKIDNIGQKYVKLIIFIEHEELDSIELITDIKI